MNNGITGAKLNSNENATEDFIRYYWQVSPEQNKLGIVLIYVMYVYMAVFFEGEDINVYRSLFYLSAPIRTGKITLIKMV